MKLDIGRVLARMRFEGLPAGLSQEDSALCLGFGGGTVQPLTMRVRDTWPDLGRQYRIAHLPAVVVQQMLTDAVTGGRISSHVRPSPEDLPGLQYKEIFVRRQPSAPVQVYLVAAPEGPGCGRTRSRRSAYPRGLSRGTEQHDGDGAHGNLDLHAERGLQGCSAAVTVLSSAYVRSPEARSVSKAPVRWTRPAGGAARPSGSSTSRVARPVRRPRRRRPGPDRCQPRPRRSCCGTWIEPCSPFGGAAAEAEEPRFPGEGPVHLDSLCPAQETLTSPGVRPRWSGCTTDSPGRRDKRRRSGPVRPRRCRGKAVGPGSRAPVRDRADCRPRLVGAIGAVRGNQRGPGGAGAAAGPQKSVTI